MLEELKKVVCDANLDLVTCNPETNMSKQFGKSINHS